LNKSDLDSLYRYAIALTKDEDSAYDLLQSGIERGLKKGVTSMDKPLAYIKVIIRNIFFDQQRRSKVIPMISLEDSNLDYEEETNDISLEDLYIQQEDVEEIIKNLSPTESELLYLWAVEEYTTEEISSLLKQPRGTILSKLHRIKKRVRDNINQLNFKHVG